LDKLKHVLQWVLGKPRTRFMRELRSPLDNLKQLVPGTYGTLEILPIHENQLRMEQLCMPLESGSVCSAFFWPSFPQLLQLKTLSGWGTGRSGEETAILENAWEMAQRAVEARPCQTSG
jgi:hypothetical protein